ncbi:MAG TPA: hypothetical protein VIP11_22870 [Gemmatimonadaceae bacterium]
MFKGAMEFDARGEGRLRAAFWAIGLALGALQGWITRQRLSSDDAIAYLDIGDAYLRGDWHAAINAYWSPLYSWLLGGVVAVVHPAIRWEFPLVKAVNFSLFVFAFVAFELFLRQIIAYTEREAVKGRDAATTVPRWAWIVFGYSAFLWTSLVFIGVSSDTPDMLVAVLFYLAAALILRIRASGATRDYVALGVVLGLGYLAKTAMFPIALVFFAVAMLGAPRRRLGVAHTLRAVLVFAVVAGPFVAAISVAKGRPTFGDTGKLNYAWVVTRYVRPFRFWEGREPMVGVPTHAPRELSRRPEVFEFSKPVAGTYPPWHDPSYWYEGVATRFRLAGQLSAIYVNVIYYAATFVAWFVLAWLALAGFGADMRRSLSALSTTWIISIPALAALAIYFVSTDMSSMNIPTQPSGRFIAAPVAVLFAVLVSSVRRSDARSAHRRIAMVATLAAALVGIELARDVGRKLQDERSREGQVAAQQVQIADTLRKLGLREGDRVAISGSYIFPYYHWARLARLKIIGEIHADGLYWDQPQATRAGILDRLHEAGATVIVQRPPQPPTDESGWISLGNGYFAIFPRAGGLD